jgi:lambda family phage tail tape measure protein
MATIENFLLRFKVEGQGAVDKASSGIKNLSNEVSQFGANTGPLNNALSGILGRLGPIGLAAGAVGGAFAALGLQAVNLAAGISDIAGATGIAEGTLLNFRTSVIEAGGKAEDFGQIAAKLNQNVQDAAGGNEKLQQSFRALGVFVTDAGGNIRSTEAILRDITQRFQEGNLSGERYAAAVDILGKNITKLDLGKLQAIADPVKDAEIKKLDEYSEAIDRVRDKLERSLLSFFGGVAQQAEAAMGKIDAYYNKLEQKEKELNQQGRTTRAFAAGGPSVTLNNAPGSMGGGSRALTAEEQAALQRRQFEEQMARLMAPAAGAPRGRTEQAAPGGFGKADPERLKREAEQRRKEQERLAEQLEREMQTIKDMTGGYRRATQANMDRYTTQVELLGKTEYEQELIKGTAEIEKKYGDQIAALEAKKATAKGQTLKLIQESIDELEGLKTSEQDIFEITRRQTFEYQQQQEAVKRITDEIEKQIDRQSQLGDILRGINDQRIDLNFEASLKGLAPLQQEIAKIQETARKAALEAGRSFSASFDSEDGLTPERAQELADGLGQIAQGYKDIANAQIEAINNLNPLMDSWEEYKNKALDSSEQIKNSFENFTNGMEDALVKFVMTGKLSFKDLAQSIIADLARIAAKRAIVAIGTSLFGFANGGDVMGKTPIVVGERGPELFIPQSAGKIVANNVLNGSAGGSSQGGGQTVVNYNIQAVDASSFRSLVAKDPSFIYAVTEQGRRSQPTRTR